VTSGVSETKVGPGERARKKAWYVGHFSSGAVANISKSAMRLSCEVKID